MRTKDQTVLLLESKYGKDFNAFFYRSDIDKFINGEVLHFIKEPKMYIDFIAANLWEDKHPFNFPGPFYTGQSNTCGTGDVEAPDNVFYDADTCEYIFRQPSNYKEFVDVLDAAAVEVFDSYACNGNKYWTYDLCKEWWHNRRWLLEQLDNPELKKVNGARSNLYRDYLVTNDEQDLKRYCFFLLHGHYPSLNEENLPAL